MKVELLDGKASLKCNLNDAIVVFVEILELDIIREEFDSISFDAGYRLRIEKGDSGKVIFKSLVNMEKLKLDLQKRGYEPYFNSELNYLQIDLGYDSEIIIKK